MTTSVPPSQRYGETYRSSTTTIAGILMIVVGICGFIDSYLILASVIIWGWLIIGFIGLGALVSGIGLMMGADWGYPAAMNLAILNIFAGFIEMLGALNIRYAILGWVGWGEAIGVITIVLSGATLYLLSRSEVRIYYD